MNRDGLDSEPFEFQQTKDGTVRISHRGKVVTTLAGREAERFLLRAAGASGQALQLLMAKATGNFKRGNERASQDPTDQTWDG